MKLIKAEKRKEKNNNAILLKMKCQFMTHKRTVLSFSMIERSTIN